MQNVIAELMGQLPHFFESAFDIFAALDYAHRDKSHHSTTWFNYHVIQQISFTTSTVSTNQQPECV